jgi:hypothetical protein
MKLNLTSTQRTALLCLLFSSGIFILWGSFLESSSYAGMADFKAVYYGARCLIHHRDPYKPGELQSVYQAEGGSLPSDPFKLRMFMSGVLTCINLPIALLLVTPLALLPWGIAHLLWMILIAASFTLAAFLTWDLAGNFAPRLSLFLICILLSNIEILYALGNLAGISVALCVVAVWCFLKERYLAAGVVCMAVALALKPHDVGLVWLYFLLVGGVQRKRAFQVLLITSALVLPALLWVWHTAPQWAPELHANLLAGSARGSLNDPGPTSLGFRYADIVICLQSIISVFRDNPRFYNPVSYLICGALLLIGAIRTLRTRFSQSNAWLALAAIAALSVLPVYHRLHDAKLLLLTIPACALLWAEGGAIRWVACVMNTAAIVFTADIPSTLLLGLPYLLHGHATGIFGNMLAVALMRPAALTVTALSVFYLYIYIRRPAPERQAAAKETEGQVQAPGQRSCGAVAAPQAYV